jgi:hypothetical protein
MSTGAVPGLLFDIDKLFDEKNFPTDNKCSTDRENAIKQMQVCIGRIKSFLSNLEWELDESGNIVLYRAYEFFHTESYELSKFQKRFNALIKKYFDPEKGLLSVATEETQQKIKAVHIRISIFITEVDCYIRNTPGLSEMIKLKQHCK